MKKSKPIRHNITPINTKILTSYYSRDAIAEIYD